MVKFCRTQPTAQAKLGGAVRFGAAVLPADVLHGHGQILGQEAGRAGLALHPPKVGRNAETARSNNFLVSAGPIG
jgi:hypothetical protein